MTFDEIVAEAMKLSTDERDALAAVLLASLDDAAGDESSVASAWEDEAHRRYEAYVAGRGEAIPWAEARERLQAGRRR